MDFKTSNEEVGAIQSFKQFDQSLAVFMFMPP